MPWAVAAVLLGFALRAAGLGVDGLWYDEAGSTYYASQPLGDIARNAIGDAHPPLYFYLQHLWIGVAGTSEYAGRYSALLPSVAAIAGLHALGRRQGGLAVGLAAATAWAVSPFAVFFAREVRMYGLLALLAILSTYALTRLVAHPTPLRVLGYGASLAAVLYLHYFGVLIFGGHALIAVRRRFVAWAATAFVAGALFVPWLWLASDQIDGLIGGERTTAGAWRIVGSTLAAFASGLTPERLGERGIDDPVLSLVLPVAAGVVAAIGARSQGVPAAWLLGSFGAALLLVLGRADFTARYLTVAAPAYALALGAGTVVLWRVRVALGILAAASLLLLSGYAIWRQQYDPRLSHEDFRSAVRHLAVAERPAQGIVLNAGYMRPVYAYYADPAWPTVEVNRGDADAEARVARLAERSSFVWLLLWQDYHSDPDGVARRWLEQNADRVDERLFRGDVRVVGYATRRSPGP